VRALIVGGSLGGLFAANMLHRIGCEVRVCERVPTTLSGRGAGIATHPALFEALRRAGATLDDSVGVDVRGRAALARDGRLIGTYDFPQVLTAWSRLHRLLTDALPADCYLGGKELVALEQDDLAVHAGFADGSRLSAELLIGADGLRSTVRGLIAPDAVPAYAGYAAWRGLVDEAALSAAVRDALFDYLSFCLVPGEQMLGYPVAGANDTVIPGERRYNFVWYRPADEATQLRRLMTDDSGRYHADGIPPHLVSRAAIDTMRSDAAWLLAPQFVEVVERTAQPFIQPIMDLASARIVFGRIALLGDAAFVARPHVGMGVTKAGEDAMALADALTSHPASLDMALARYEAERLRVGRFIVDRGRYLGLPLSPIHRTEEERRLALTNGTPDFVMRTAAVAPALP
jgi:2-polyprenyl-6-methoxyphenol hydroxylase-like FAD-dependent oxidoreductase